MGIEEAIRSAVYEIGNAAHSIVGESSDARAFAFPTPAGFCLIGIVRWSDDYQYIDIRWRVLVGQVTPGFDWTVPMRANHDSPEVPYGAVTLEGKTILTITDTFRVLMSWGPEEIGEIIRLRFGGAFAVPLALPGVAPLGADFLSTLLREYGYRSLLSISSG